MTQITEPATDVTLQKGGSFDEIEVRPVPRDHAVDELANGNIDIYLDALTDRTYLPEDLRSVKAMSHFVSVVFNPSPSQSTINPFSIKRFRQFAMYNLLDRERIVSDLFSSLGTETQPMWLDFSDFNPDYLSAKDVIGEHRDNYGKSDVVETQRLMQQAMIEAGASMSRARLLFGDHEISANVFVRDDNPILKAIAEDFIRRLQTIGLTCNVRHGDLSDWRRIAYGSDPSLQAWHVGFESFAYSGNVRYEVDAKFCYTYGPWAGSLPPCLHQPGWWRYENQQLDNLTRQLYGGAYATMQERREIIRSIARHALDEAVRALVLTVKGSFVYNPTKVNKDLVTDPYVGPRTYFWAHDIRPAKATASKRLTIGLSRVHASAYNKVAGFTDSSSMCVYTGVHDHGVFAHPTTGLWTSYRYYWDLVNDGPNSRLEVPADALTYDGTRDEFQEIGMNKKCTSRVRLKYVFGKWHHGENQNMNDILHFLYFMFKWSKKTDSNDSRYDPWWASINSEIVKRVVGFKILGDDSIELYLDYWHPEMSEIGCWINCWPWHPWELMSISESVVEKQLVAFSLAAAEDNGVPILDLTKEPSLCILSKELDAAKKTRFIPRALQPFVEAAEAEERYEALAAWADQHHHYMIMAGPYYFERIDEETGSEILRSIRLLGRNVAESYPLRSDNIRMLAESESRNPGNVILRQAC